MNFEYAGTQIEMGLPGAVDLVCFDPCCIACLFQTQEIAVSSDLQLKVQSAKRLS